jgi:hypothetical protein
MEMSHDVCLLGFAFGVLVRLAWGVLSGEYRGW